MGRGREERLKRKSGSEHNWTLLCFLPLFGLEGGVRQDLGHMVIIPSEIPSVTPPHPNPAGACQVSKALIALLSLNKIVLLYRRVSKVT